MDNIKKNKGGRPKGMLNKIGLTLDQRIKILSKIATNKDSKPNDVISACDMITKLLNDKIKEAKEGIETTIIKFEETIKKPQHIVENIVIKQEDIPLVVSNTISTINTEIIEKPKENEENKENKEEESISFNFNIEKHNDSAE